MRAVRSTRLWDPATNTWTQGTSGGAPASRHSTSGAWTGRTGTASGGNEDPLNDTGGPGRFIVWGGGSGSFNTGGIYTPP